MYARSRHGNNGQGSDFARSARQQQIVDALKQQVLSIGGIGDLPGLLQALGNNVDTNMTIDDAEAIYYLVEGVNSASILHVSLDDSNFLYECGYPTNCGADYLFAHNSGYGPIAQFVQSVFVPSVGAERGSHGGDRGRQRHGRWGLHQMGRYLRSVGLDDPGPGPGPDHVRVTEVIDQSGGKDAAAAEWFAAYFGVSVTTVPPPSPGATGTTDGVLVLLGQDEESNFNHDPGYGS